MDWCTIFGVSLADVVAVHEDLPSCNNDCRACEFRIKVKSDYRRGECKDGKE